MQDLLTAAVHRNEKETNKGDIHYIFFNRQHYCFTKCFVVTLIPALQNASAEVVHHNAHIASSQASATAVAAHHIGRTVSQGTSSVHKVVAVIPETHDEPITVVALKKPAKGPYDNVEIVESGLAINTDSDDKTYLLHAFERNPLYYIAWAMGTG